MTQLYNQRHMKDKRKELRSSMTYEEATLWNVLRKHFQEARFRRQYSIGPYILDFYSPQKRIAIEVDGVQHLDSAYDRERDRYIASCNIRILRFWNKDINTNLEGVYLEIKKVLDS